MQCVPSTLHGCLKYIENEKVHYVWMNEEPFIHCNNVELSYGDILPSTHIYHKIIHVN